MELYGSERRADQYLSHLPPVPELAFEGSVFLAIEFNRIRAGKPPVKFSMRRARASAPEQIDDVEGWEAALAQKKTEHGYLTTRMLHLQLLLKYGKDAWTSYNDLLSYNKDHLDRTLEETKIQVNEVNLARKREHTSVGGKLARLEARYGMLVEQGAAVEEAIEVLKKQKQQQ